MHLQEIAIIIPGVKPRTLIPLIVSAICLACLLPLAGAKSWPKTKEKARPTPFHVVIESVSASSITVKKQEGDVTYKIDRNTEISYKGQTVTADQLQAGMRVSVTADAVDATLASLVQAEDPPKAAPSASPKKK